MKDFDKATAPAYVALEEGKIFVTAYTLDEFEQNRTPGNAWRIMKEVTAQSAALMNSGADVTLSRQAGAAIYDLAGVSGTLMYGTERILSGCKLDQTAPLKRPFAESLVNSYIHSYGLNHAIRVVSTTNPEKGNSKIAAAARPEPVT